MNQELELIENIKSAGETILMVITIKDNRYHIHSKYATEHNIALLKDMLPGFEKDAEE